MPRSATDSRTASALATTRASRRRSGFSLTELLVVILIIGVLSGIVLTVVAKMRNAAANTRCLSNLQQIALAFQQYAAANKGRLPDPLSSEVSFEQSISRHLGGGAGVFECPSDEELFGLLGSSYDWRDTPDAETTLAGKQLSAVRGDAILAFEALPDWHRKNNINAATCSGAVQTMDRDACLGDLDKPVR